MRITRFIIPLVALALCVMPAVALASGSGTTQAIVKDVAKDGKVDGHYTQAQLHAALKSPLLKQYGGQAAVESVVTQHRADDGRRTCDGRCPRPAVHGLRRDPLRRRRWRTSGRRPRAQAVWPARRRGFPLAHPSAASRRRPRCPCGTAAGALFRADFKLLKPVLRRARAAPGSAASRARSSRCGSESAGPARARGDRGSRGSRRDRSHCAGRCGSGT